VRVGRRGPLVVGHLLILPLPVEPAQFCVGRVLDAGLGRQLLEVIFPKKNGYEVNGGSGCTSVQTRPGIRTPRRNNGGRGCRKLPGTRISPLAPGRGSRTSHPVRPRTSAARRTTPPGRCPSTDRPRSCCRSSLP